MSNWDDYGYYQPSKPREARGGIKAQSKRGGFGKSWWAKRWIEVLESFHTGARLSRGKAYARSGQVLSIDIDQGTVRARVQGSRRSPYNVSIQVKTLSGVDWQKIIQAISSQAVFVAKLLAGAMPPAMELVFNEVGLSLFPAKGGDLTTSCSCPDYSNPCKHIAAVYYLLGEEFDRDPFLIFKLRGMHRDELLGLLGDDTGTTPLNQVEEIPSPEPLSADPVAFWEGAELADDFWGEVRVPTMAAALPKQLGNFPFWRGREDLLATLETIYANASATGLDTLIGGKKEGLLTCENK